MNYKMQTTESTQEPVPFDAASLPPASSTNAQFVTIHTALILCLITSVLTLMIAFYAPQIAAQRGITMPGSSGPKVVYLDMEKIVSAGMKKSINSEALGVTDISVAAAKFQVEMTAAIKNYTDSGYIVINHRALISGSPTLDITRDVITSLGIQ
jgi:hypothetical protein